MHRRRTGRHGRRGDGLSTSISRSDRGELAHDLPYIDAHEVAVAAPPGDVWAAIEPALDSAFGRARSRALERILGCDDGGGFHVGRSDPPRRLALEGRHRFSRYALTFEIEPAVAGSKLRAVTHAEFPRLRGRLYRALVIGSGGHRIVTRRLLKSIARRAERITRASPSMMKEER